MRGLLGDPAAAGDKSVDGRRAVHSRYTNRRVLFTDEAVVDVTAWIFDIATMAFPDGATGKEADPSGEVADFERALEGLYLKLFLRLHPWCHV
jgi:hypothetical protein